MTTNMTMIMTVSVIVIVTATMAKMEVLVTTVVARATKTFKWTTDLPTRYDDSSRERTRYKEQSWST